MSFDTLANSMPVTQCVTSLVLVKGRKIRGKKVKKIKEGKNTGA